MKKLLLASLLLSTAMGAETLAFNARSTDPHNELATLTENLRALENQDSVIAAVLRASGHPANMNQAAQFLTSVKERRAAINAKPKMDTFSQTLTHARNALKRAYHQIEGIGEEEDQLLDELEREARNLRAKRQCRQADPTTPRLDNHLRLSPPEHIANPNLNNTLRQAITNSQQYLEKVLLELQNYSDRASPQLTALLSTLVDPDAIIAQVMNILTEIQTTLGKEELISFQSVQSLIDNNFYGLSTVFKGGNGDQSQTLLHRLIGGFQSKKQPAAYQQDPTLFTLASLIPETHPLYAATKEAIGSLLSLLRMTSSQFGAKLSNEVILEHIPHKAKDLLRLYSPIGTSIQDLRTNISRWRQSELHSRLAILDSAVKIKTEELAATQEEQESQDLNNAMTRLATEFNGRSGLLTKLRALIKRKKTDFNDPGFVDATQAIQDFIDGHASPLDSLFKDPDKKHTLIRQIQRAQDLNRQAIENREYRATLHKIADASQKHYSFMRLLERLVREVKPEYINPEYPQPREAWSIIRNSWNTASYLAIDPEQRARLYVNGLTSLGDEMVWLDAHKFNACDFATLREKYILARDAIALINLGEASESYTMLPGFEILENPDRMDEESFAQDAPPPPPPPGGLGAYTWDTLSTNIDRIIRLDPSKKDAVLAVLSTAYTETLTYIDVPVPTAANLRDTLRANNLY